MAEPTPASSDTAARLHAASLRRARLSTEVEAVLVTDPDNIRWLTGERYRSPERWMLWAGGQWHTLVKGEARRIGTEPHHRIREDRHLLHSSILDICRGFRVPDPLLVDRGPRWAHLRETGTGVTLADGRAILDSTRQYKDSVEIAIMAQNARIVKELVEVVCDQLRPGVSELELWAAVVLGLRRREPDDLQIYGNCASGPRTVEADPRASPRRIEPGDPFLLDVYPRIQGYFADLTRTLCCRTTSRELGRMIEAVRDALARTAELLMPGVAGADLDREARKVLTKHGYSEAYRHHTGHGLGVKQQERPWIRPRSADIIREGMTIALEPGCYIEGVGGVRLEDEFLVTRHGATPLTSV